MQLEHVLSFLPFHLHGMLQYNKNVISTISFADKATICANTFNGLVADDGHETLHLNQISCLCCLHKDKRTKESNATSAEHDFHCYTCCHNYISSCSIESQKTCMKQQTYSWWSKCIKEHLLFLQHNSIRALSWDSDYYNIKQTLEYMIKRGSSKCQLLACLLIA